MLRDMGGASWGSSRHIDERVDRPGCTDGRARQRAGRVSDGMRNKSTAASARRSPSTARVSPNMPCRLNEPESGLTVERRSADSRQFRRMAAPADDVFNGAQDRQPRRPMADSVGVRCTKEARLLLRGLGAEGTGLELEPASAIEIGLGHLRRRKPGTSALFTRFRRLETRQTALTSLHSPWRVALSEKLLIGKRLDNAVAEAAGQAATEGANPVRQWL